MIDKNTWPKEKNPFIFVLNCSMKPLYHLCFSLLFKKYGLQWMSIETAVVVSLMTISSAFNPNKQDKASLTRCYSGPAVEWSNNLLWYLLYKINKLPSIDFLIAVLTPRTPWQPAMCD